MSDARIKLERLFGGPAPAPTIAPSRPDVKPGTRPAPAPSRPEPQHPNPWRRREMKPGETERPRAQAALRREATEFLRLNDFEDIV